MRDRPLSSEKLRKNNDVHVVTGIFRNLDHNQLLAKLLISVGLCGRGPSKWWSGHKKKEQPTKLTGARRFASAG